MINPEQKSPFDSSVLKIICRSCCCCCCHFVSRCLTTRIVRYSYIVIISSSNKKKFLYLLLHFFYLIYTYHLLIHAAFFLVVENVTKYISLCVKHKSKKKICRLLNYSDEWNIEKYANYYSVSHIKPSINHLKENEINL